MLRFRRKLNTCDGEDLVSTVLVTFRIFFKLFIKNRVKCQAFLLKMYFLKVRNVFKHYLSPNTHLLMFEIL